MATPAFLPENIATEQPVIHPALDWLDDTLLMGVIFTGGERAVLTSNGKIVALDQLGWVPCERARNFDRSPVTENVARLLQTGFGTPADVEYPYALVNVPARLAAYYRRFMAFPFSWWPELLGVWTLGTYMYPIFTAYPYLRISSPEPGCGKSLLGEIIANLSFNGELMVSPTEANMFRLPEAQRGTQVWDEVENQHEAEKGRLLAMKAVLLNGYRSGGAVTRQERGKKGEFNTVRFHVYVPRVLIGLTDLPQVVQQRTIELTLHRRHAGEQVERYIAEERREEELALREACALYALTYCQAAARHYRSDALAIKLEQHVGQAGRLVHDLLLPLFTVASAALDNDMRSQDTIVPLLNTLYREAAPAVSKGWDEGAKMTPLWLGPILDILEEKGAGTLTPADLSALLDKHARIQLSPEQLSHGLKKYGLRSEKKNGRRAYFVSQEQIEQLRARYLAPQSDEMSEGKPFAVAQSTTGQ